MSNKVIDEVREVTITPLAKPTGPFGFWWFPLLVYLAQIFPWAKRLLEKLTENRSF